MRENLSKSITAGALAGVFVLTGGSAALASTGGNNPTEEGLQEMLDAIGGDTGSEDSGSNGSTGDSDTDSDNSADVDSPGDTGADDGRSVEVEGYYQATTKHILIESEQTTHPLAPGETAYWFVDVSSLTGEPATAYADLEAGGNFGYTITVHEGVSDEIIYSEHSSNITDSVELDELELTDGANYTFAITADSDAPQNANADADLTVTAMGESVEAPPETPDGPEGPGNPDEPETPERPERPVPPTLDEPREPVETTPREIPTAERDDSSAVTPPVDEENPDNPLIESGYINENPGIFWGAVFSAFAGLVLIGIGTTRFIRNRSASGSVVSTDNNVGGAK